MVHSRAQILVPCAPRNAIWCRLLASLLPTFMKKNKNYGLELHCKNTGPKSDLIGPTISKLPAVRQYPSSCDLFAAMSIRF